MKPINVFWWDWERPEVLGPTIHLLNRNGYSVELHQVGPYIYDAQGTWKQLIAKIIAADVFIIHPGTLRRPAWITNLMRAIKRLAPKVKIVIYRNAMIPDWEGLVDCYLPSGSIRVQEQLDILNRAVRNQTP